MEAAPHARGHQKEAVPMTYVFSGLGYDFEGSAKSDLGINTDCYSGGANRDTAVACAGEAGGKVAAAACLATPGLELAAPLCSEAGQWIAENLAGPIYDGAVEIFEGLFGGPKGTSPAEASNAASWHVSAAFDAYNHLASQIVRIYKQKVEPEVKKVGGTPDPMELWRAQALLDTFGAKKLIADQIASGKPYGFYPAAAIKCWFVGKDWWLPYHELVRQNNACGYMFADALADAWRASMAPAYGKTLSWLTSDAAKQVAKAKAKAAELARVQAKAKKKAKEQKEAEAEARAGAWHLALGVGVLAAGGGLWWWSSKRRRRR